MSECVEPIFSSNVLQIRCAHRTPPVTVYGLPHSNPLYFNDILLTQILTTCHTPTPPTQGVDPMFTVRHFSFISCKRHRRTRRWCHMPHLEWHLRDASENCGQRNYALSQFISDHELAGACSATPHTRPTDGAGSVISWRRYDAIAAASSAWSWR